MGRGYTRGMRRLDETMLQVTTKGEVRDAAGRAVSPFAGLLERGADMRPFYGLQLDSYLDYRIYRHPQQVRGGGRLGCIEVDPGYLRKGKGWRGRGKHQPHIRARKPGKRRSAITTTRPGLSSLSDRYLDDYLDAMTDYILRGQLRRARP